MVSTSTTTMRPAATAPTADTADTAATAVTDTHTQRQRRVRRHTRRERVASSLYNLTLDAHDLRQQIRELAQRRALLNARPRALATSLLTADSSSFLKVQRLFQVFNLSYGPTQESTTDMGSVARAYTETLTGGAALFEYWHQHADLFASTRCEVHSIRMVPVGSHEYVTQANNDDQDQDQDDDEADNATAITCVLRVDGTSHGTFTIGSLHAVWPDVLHEPERTQALLGRAMATPMVLYFAFSRAGRIVRYAAKPDLDTALACGLGRDAAAGTEAQRSSVGGVHRQDYVVDGQNTPVKPLPLLAAAGARHSVAFLVS